MNATSPNKLKRETAFLCPAEFRNDLPLVPSDWKFLQRPNLCESISDYHHVSLIGEARDAVLPADLGLTVDPLLSSSYREKQFRPPMEHVDNKLLEEEKDREMVADNHKIRNKRPDMSKALWLMNTQYISSMPLPEHLGRSEKDWAKHKQIRDQDAAPNDSHIQQIKSIDRSFTAVKHRLSKDSSQDVFPIMELPVLPDFAHSSSSFVHFIYDEDPSDDARPENGSCLTRMHTALENSFVKPYSVNCLRGDTGAEKLVALMLPSLSNHDTGARKVNLDKLNYEEYNWIREYQYRLHRERANSHKSMCFFFDKEHNTRYMELSARILLSKRSKHSKGTRDGANFRPSKITIKKPLRNQGAGHERIKT